MTGSRIAMLRSELREAQTASECVPVCAALIWLAAKDDVGPRARASLDDAITYLRAAVASLPASAEEHRLALYLLARADLLRADDSFAVPDIDDAIACLRRLGAMLSDGTPDRLEADAWLVDALFTRSCRIDGRLADVDEAIALMEPVSVRPPADARQEQHRAASLAVLYGTRFAFFGGTEADRGTAEEHARGCLGPSAGDEIESSGHYILAWMALARRLTDSQRSCAAWAGDMEAARTDRQMAQSLFQTLGEFQIAREDAETAIGHLRQARQLPAHQELRSLAPMFWGLALLATQRQGEAAAPGYAAEAGLVAEDLERMVAEADPATPAYGEFQALRGAMLAMRAEAPAAGGSDREQAAAAEALRTAAEGLPADSLARSSLLGSLSHILGQQVAQAPSADDIGTRLDEIAQAMDLMPDDDPVAADMMLGVGLEILKTFATHRSALTEDRVIPNLERFASGMRAGSLMRPAARFMESFSRGMFGIARHRPADADAAIAEMTSCVTAVAPDHVAMPIMLLGLAIAYMERHGMGGEIRHLEQAEKYVVRGLAAKEAGRFTARGGTLLEGTLLFIQGHLQVIRGAYDPDPNRFDEAIATLERAESRIVNEPSLAPALAFELNNARTLRELHARLAQPGSPGASEVRNWFQDLEKTAEYADPEDPDRAFHVAFVANSLIYQGRVSGDVASIDQGLAKLAGACRLPGLALREQTRLLDMHGYGFLSRYQLTGDPRDLGHAIHRLEQARRSVEQETGSPQAAEVLLELSGAYRLRADQAGGESARRDADRAQDLGLAGLREHAGDVFLQDNDENALLRAARGAGDASAVARWLLARGRNDAAIGAIELGRGMVLHAATSGGRAEAVLREAGHESLADEWRAQGTRPDGRDGGEPGDLRYRVMLAIERSPAEARLLAPPSVDDIGAALEQSGADALVYLLPKDDDGEGLAVLVYPDGTVATLVLPALRTGEGSPVRALADARRSQEMDEEERGTTDTVRDRWQTTLDALCDWAWSAAVGPLLHRVRDDRSTTWPRLILVPAGELGLVPWHAAREPSSGRRAVQGAVFLYAASARQVTDAARPRSRPWSADPVLVCDASSSLYLTAVTIAHLHDAHYGSGAIYGAARRRVEGSPPGAPSATREDVLSTFPRDGTEGASLLHFGCHGRVRIPVLDSALSLGRDSAGREAQVAIRDILRETRARSAAERDQRADGGLVVLAACVTDVTERDFDEALSLATALMSAGASGVVATRWSVPESHTALLMTAFHQFLNDGYPDPALALRRAQLWMLDPDRKVPGWWPKALREEAEAAQADADGLARPEAWAGFAYQGR